MSLLQDRFEQAQKNVNQLSRRPDNDTLLKLYAYYKQATSGDAGDERPGGFDFVKQAKYDAWSKIRGTSQQEAMKHYIELAASLKN